MCAQRHYSTWSKIFLFMCRHFETGVVIQRMHSETDSVMTLYVSNPKKAGLQSCPFQSGVWVIIPLADLKIKKQLKKHIAHLLSLMDARDIASFLDILVGSKGGQISSNRLPNKYVKYGEVIDLARTGNK
ncbi:hypothetical protein GJ496_007271 [Pomphorhynchus laevis]|nr:hypothetical protein GJ496_007271 [Pomphorhynchus laevis]